jgi:hypothetical protein
MRRAHKLVLLHPTIKILMRLKASLLVTASCMTLVLVCVGLLHSTSQPADDAEQTIDALSLVTPLLPPPLVPAKPPAQASKTAEAVDALLDRRSQSDTDTNETLKRRFSVDNSLDRVKQLDRLLAKGLPATAKNPPTSDKQSAASSRTTPQTQTSAHNWVSAVTGTLKKQDYEIKKLELALAQKQFKDGEIPQTALVQKQARYQKAAREFKTFLNSFRIAD